MSASWPSNLPQLPLARGYSRKLRDTRTKTNNQSGAAKVRNRFTAAPEDVTENYLLDAAQKLTLEQFYKNILKNGALRFTKKEPESGLLREYRIAEPLQFAREGIYYTITLQLELMP